MFWVGVGVFVLGYLAQTRILNEALPDIPAPAHIPDTYRLIFFDEFDRTGLNSDKWRLPYADNHPHSAGFISSKMNRQPGDGYLYLFNDYQDDRFLLSMIRSVPTFKYGYFETRIQFHNVEGHHGAFWLQSPTYGQIQDDPAQSGAEIDIIEFFGNGRIATDAKHSIFWNAYEGGNLREVRHDIFYRDAYGEELSAAFHTFGLLWTSDEYVFFIDGVETWRTTDAVSQTDQYLLLSLIISSQRQIEQINALIDTGFQLNADEMIVDYVRVYAP